MSKYKKTYSITGAVKVKKQPSIALKAIKAIITAIKTKQAQNKQQNELLAPFREEVL